ncbi:MAG: hypothetical protein J0M00_00450, partial [Burkholderiales bacterium]|nr:hypothetical protein [Burkholderiales bacterium]
MAVRFEQTLTRFGLAGAGLQQVGARSQRVGPGQVAGTHTPLDIVSQAEQGTHLGISLGLFGL